MGWIILILVFLLVLWALWAPITLFIDSTQSEYRITWGRVLEVVGLADKDWKVYLQIRVFFYTTTIPLFPGTSGRKKPHRKKPAKKKKPGTLSFQKVFGAGKRILRSFNIIQWEVDIDTDDYVLNAYLWPFFYLLTRTKGGYWNINFEGRMLFKCIIQNRLARIGWAFLFR